MINKIASFVLNGPDEGAPMADWVIWVPLMPVAAVAVWLGFTLFMIWVLLCMFLGIGDDDD